MRRLAVRLAVVLGCVALAALTFPSHAQDAAGDAAVPAKRDPADRDLTEYQVRVGDTLDVTVLDHPEVSRVNITVPGNGEVSFLPIGKLTLKDKTVTDIEREVAERLKSEEILLNARVFCNVTNYAPRDVFIIGAVHAIVPLPVYRNMRLLEVLARSTALGDPTADLSKVTVNRRGPDGSTTYRLTISVNDIIDKNDDKQNIVIFEGDYINVPRLQSANPLSADFVYVLGEVKVPGRQPIVTGPTPFTLTKLVALCGDFLDYAKRDSIVIIRTTVAGKERLEVDFDAIIEGKQPDIELKADDLVFVPESFF